MHFAYIFNQKVPQNLQHLAIVHKSPITIRFRKDYIVEKS